MNEENIQTFSVTKPTFSAVHSAQETLRIFLEELIQKNRSLKPDERSRYYDLIASSTLGLGVNRGFKIYIDCQIFRFGNIESASRWLGQQKENMACIPPIYGNKGSQKVDISFFWSTLLDELFYIFPLALDRAISMSKEDTEIHRPQIHGAKVGSKI